MQMHALLHINAPPKGENQPQVGAANLIQIHFKKVDQALQQ